MWFKKKKPEEITYSVKEVSGDVEITDIPSEFTKSEEDDGTDEKHAKHLLEIMDTVDEADAKIICEVMARKYPNVLIDALKSQMNMMNYILNDVHDSADAYINYLSLRGKTM